MTADQVGNATSIELPIAVPLLALEGRHRPVQVCLDVVHAFDAAVEALEPGDAVIHEFARRSQLT